MRGVVRALGLLIVSVMGAHALAFCALQGLPDPAVAALGLGSVTTARASFEADRPRRTYGETVVGMTRGDLGSSLDGTSVRTEIVRASAASSRRMLAAIVVVGAVVAGAAFAPRTSLPILSSVGSVFVFLPPFLLPFVGLGFLLAWPGAMSEHWTETVSVLCLAVPAAALAATQASRITARHLAEPFAVTQRALGMSIQRQRVRLLANLTAELSPTLEKLAIGLLTALLFVEPVLAQNGLGALMLRGLRRSDTDIVLALVLMTALTIAVLRILGAATRATYGLRAP